MGEGFRDYNPEYPPQLFRDLSKLVPKGGIVWDCACGSGQASRSLADYFPKVVATDASAAQIKNALGKPGVSYQVAPAEKAPFEAKTVDLVTVAQALHWFHFDEFYAEVRRVVRPGGLIAAWAYAFLLSGDPRLDAFLMDYPVNTLGEYWETEPKMIWNGYRDIPFPFTEVEMPTYEMQVLWSLQDLVGYFSSWSATQKFIEKNGTHPIEPLFEEWKSAWGHPNDRRELRCPLVLKVGKV